MLPQQYFKIYQVSSELLQKIPGPFAFPLFRTSFQNGLRQGNDFIALSIVGRKLTGYLCFEILQNQARVFFPLSVNPGINYGLLLDEVLKYSFDRFKCNIVSIASFLDNKADVIVKTFGYQVLKNGGCSFMIEPEGRVKYYPSPDDTIFFERLDGNVKIFRNTLHNGNAGTLRWNDAEQEAENIVFKVQEDYLEEEENERYGKRLKDIINQSERPDYIENVRLGLETRFAKVFKITLEDEIRRGILGTMEYAQDDTTLNDHYIAIVTIGGNLDLGLEFQEEKKEGALHISYVARFLQGMVYRVKEHLEEASIPNTDEIFKSILRFNKSELGHGVLGISHYAGSTAMLRRNLTDRARKKDIIPDESYEDVGDGGYYGMDNFKINFRLCNMISCLNIGYLQWENNNNSSFCSQRCAKHVWENKKN